MHFFDENGEAGGIGVQGTCLVALREPQLHQPSLALFIFIFYAFSNAFCDRF